MKKTLLMAVGGLLMATSSMFAGWGISVGVAPGYVYAPPPPYVYEDPYAYEDAPPVYVAPPAVVWVPGYWSYGPYGRFWVDGHYDRHEWRDREGYRSYGGGYYGRGYRYDHDRYDHDRGGYGRPYGYGYAHRR